MGHSAVALMKHHGFKGRDLGHGLVGWGVNAGVGAGAGYGLGYAYGRYRDKWYGKHAPTVGAIAGKLGSVVIQVVTGGPSVVSGMVDSVGQAGLALIGAKYGAKHGAEKAGRQAVFMPAGALPAGAVQIGQLGQAAPGRGLSWDQINELASMR